VVLDVPDVDELVLELRHRVPGKAALRRAQVEGIHAGIDHPIAKAPVFEYFGGCVGLARARIAIVLPADLADALRIGTVLRPRRERVLILLEVEVGEEERVVRHPPESGVPVGRIVPRLTRTLLDREAKGLQAGVILRLERRLDAREGQRVVSAPLHCPSIVCRGL
jgi:hypothetical protein